MEFLGIGPQELIYIIIIAIIVLGPKDMQKAGRTVGRWLNQFVRSDTWKIFQRTSSELRNLPRNLMREANMEMTEAERDLRRAIDPRLNPPAPRVSAGESEPQLKDMNPTAQSQPPRNKTYPPADSRDAAASTPDPDEHV